MKISTYLLVLLALLFLLHAGCSQVIEEQKSKAEIPITNHDLSYIPFDSKYDDPEYIICDSTQIVSGRNRLNFREGRSILKENIISNYSYRNEYHSFDGFVVIRFIVNCEGITGRYRAQALNLDFSPTTAPADLIAHSIEVIKTVDHWGKSSTKDKKTEYSKFINLKFSNGKIQHVLL